MKASKRTVLKAKALEVGMKPPTYKRLQKRIDRAKAKAANAETNKKSIGSD